MNPDISFAPKSGHFYLLTPDTSFVLKSGHFHLLTTLTDWRRYERNPNPPPKDSMSDSAIMRSLRIPEGTDEQNPLSGPFPSLCQQRIRASWA